MKIGIIGTGYVGLVSGVCFAEMGNDVWCVDVDEEKVAGLQQGKMPIYEPDLDVLLHRNLRDQRLTFTTSLNDALENSEIIFLALPTPPDADGEADLSYVLQVSHTIGAWLGERSGAVYRIIVNKSTVPVGTADKVREVLRGQGANPGRDFDVVSNPEFLREGAAVDDFMKPERVVLGTSSTKAADKMQRLYEPFVRQGNPIIIMDERSAEVTKYAANAFLASRISFMNEVANLCDRVGADVDKVRIGVGSDRRIGRHFLYAGIGFGGSCFPKDVQALLRTARSNDYDFKILRAVLDVNEKQRKLLIERIRSHFGNELKGKHAAVWGLAFKANTDDVRESPAHVVIRGLLASEVRITAFDPEAMMTSRAVLGESINYAKSAYGALPGVDMLIICTEWPEFRRPDFERIKGLMRRPLIFDGRNLYNAHRMMERGFEYHSIGRPGAALE
ncbi:MAG: UDP-glucose/GDP-mannose dehydrogenase family protein [Bacteroidetes bacterium]|nr:UDP-glucose/GDP-mannose dehydrogenase family protein [Bacteroidota bacterium]MCY4205493.1 UDP-glucose/GDP-mannose dehydrogenase family protein [Bacteroidota bacterium]